jgi:acetyltransferase
MKPAAAETGTDIRAGAPEPLDAIFRPRSIAVIGASRRRGSIGHEILHNLVEHDFQGVVFPVHPTATVIHSIKAYPSVLEIPDPVDLAVVVVPYRHVLEVAEECGRKGVRGLVVITAGFREVGGEGVAREEALLAIVHRYGMQLVGPNCMGVINTEPEVSMNATFAPTFPPPGPIGFMSQSGALGVTILDHARELGLGVSMFVSVGNKADVSGNKMIDYWSRDPRTRLIVMYNESFGDPRRFTRLARRVTKEKPILAVKAGRTRTGAKAASSHTGALAGMDVAVDALFEQCGVIRATTLEELFDFAMAFSNQPVPRGDRVAIITNAGGPGILTADACESLGLEIATLTEETRARLRAEVAEEASVQNPVDLIASADAATYRVALDIVLQDPNIDAAIAIFVPPVQVDAGEVAAGIAETVDRHDKTVLGCLMGKKGVQLGMTELKRHSIRRSCSPSRRRGRWRRCAATGAGASGRWGSRCGSRSTASARQRPSPRRVRTGASSCLWPRSRRCWAPTGSRWRTAGSRPPPTPRSPPPRNWDGRSPSRSSRPRSSTRPTWAAFGSGWRTRASCGRRSRRSSRRWEPGAWRASGCSAWSRAGGRP